MNDLISDILSEDNQAEYYIKLLSEVWEDEEGAECAAILKSCAEEITGKIKELVLLVEQSPDDKSESSYSDELIK